MTIVCCFESWWMNTNIDEFMCFDDSLFLQETQIHFYFAVLVWSGRSFPVFPLQRRFYKCSMLECEFSSTQRDLSKYVYIKGMCRKSERIELENQLNRARNRTKLR